MKKKLLIFFVLTIATVVVYTISTQKNTTEKVQAKYQEFLKNHPYNETLKLTKKERRAKGMPPNKYFEQEYLLEMNPNTGRTHPENIFEVQKQLASQRKLQRVPGDASDNKWVERGPDNVGGRTRAVLFDPNDVTQKRVFAGGVSGGLWVNNDITDENSSWTQVGISENLSVSCITVDPNNSQIWYLGTGESHTSGQAFGNGVWKSIDGGTTWSNIFSDTFNVTVRDRLFFINTIKAWNNPNTNKTEVFIGVAGASDGISDFPGANIQGLYKTIDDGTSWNKVTLPGIDGTASTASSNVPEPNDIEIGSDNTIWIGTTTNIWGQGGGTILKSTNGSTFTKAYTLTTLNPRRTEIAVSKQNANTLYVLASNRNTNGSGATIAPFVTMLKTTNGFASTIALNLPSDADTGINATDFTRGQAEYDLMLEVDPNDDTVVYTGGIDLFKSTTSGSLWVQQSHWYGGFGFQNVHADQHSIAFANGSSTKILFGNDGGVFYSSDGGTVTSARNKGYNVTQFYNGAIGQSVANEMLMSGAQDNGTQIIDGANAGINSSVDLYGGDGAYSFIDKDGEYVIVSYVYNTTRRVNLPLVVENPAIPRYAGVNLGDDDKSGKFINPADLDDNLDILYTNATREDKDSIARFTDIKTATPIRKNFSDASLNGGVTVLKVSPFTTTSTKLFVGTDNGSILKIEDANTNNPKWNSIKGNVFTGDLSIAGSISAIEFGANEDEIMVAFHNYGVDSIWFTTNGGLSWSNKEGDFPDIPVKAIMMNPLNNDEVIIGTQLGVWRTSNFKDASPKWIQSYNGMSNVKVTSFSLRTADNVVLASTHGRGMFTGQFATGVASVDDVVNESKVFTMYPTVSDGNFTVFAKNTLGKTKLQLFNINGKEVYAKQIDFTQESKQPVSVNLSAGVYIVSLIDSNNKKVTSKVIIK